MLSRNILQTLWLFISILIYGLFFTEIVIANKSRTYPNCCIKNLSNFKIYCEEIFSIVANKMEVRLDEKIRKPKILTDEQLTLAQFNGFLGWESNEILPYYFYKHNIIVIPTNCTLSDLLHEIVHYFQVTYLSIDFECNFGMMVEAQELEAIRIQRWFEMNYLRASSTR